MPDLSIIIVTYNHESEIKNCLLTLKNAIAQFNAEIIIIDNNSTDETISIFQSLLRDFDKKYYRLMIFNQTNIGFTKAVNQGLARSQEEFVLLLNPDTEIPSDIFQSLIQIFENNSDVGIVSPQFRNPDGTIQPSCRRFPRHRDVIYNAIGLNVLFNSSKEFNYWKMGDFDHQTQKEVEQPQGAFLLARREAVEDVGFLDEQFPMFFSDVDWCRRFIEKGWKILFVPGVQIMHHKGTSIYKNRVKMIWSSHWSFCRYFWKYYRGLSWSPINLITGVVLIFLALIRSIFHLVKSKT
ncbi:glycosyltransferase family 2 protein [candidate division KSB1 bacterium]|nr:glycosyltransferase family 2 protein [candidate division KSB1 bacterium]